jgi:hypothetical protein
VVHPVTGEHGGTEKLGHGGPVRGFEGIYLKDLDVDPAVDQRPNVAGEKGVEPARKLVGK